MRAKQTCIFILILTILIISPILGAPITIKTAVVMPEKSTWTNTLVQMTQDIEKQTEGSVKFKIYAGGISGDEANVIRKMRANRVHAGGFSGIGLSMIVPEIRILESVLLYRNHQELDWVKDQLFESFQQKFEKKGYILLGFFDGGAAYFFTQKNIDSVRSLQETKMWIWKGDQIADLFLKEIRVNRFPLPITEVITGLETGMINGFYAPPLAAVSLQWYPRVRYVLDYPFVNAIGAFIVSKKTYNRIGKEHRSVFALSAKKYCGKLVSLTRNENEEALSILKNSGITFQLPKKDQIDLFQRGALRSMEESVPKIYSKALLDRVNKLLKQFRERNKTR